MVDISVQTNLSLYGVNCCEIFAVSQKSDTVMLSIVNCLAVIYIYNQFSSLRKAGSKYLLGEHACQGES